MKRLLNRILAALLLSGLFAITTLAQTSAQEIADNLHSQLTEVQVRKAEMQARDEQLEEDLNPENIERSMAVTGSTRPELLRERRRRQLEIARVRVQAEIEDLDRRNTSLERAIAEADAAAYMESAGMAYCTTQSPNDLP